MLREQNPSRIEPEQSALSPTLPGESPETGLDSYSETARTGEIDVQTELEKLKELILGSFHIPFTRYTVVDEDQLLDYIELVQYNLPKAFELAAKIIERREKIIEEAKEYAQEFILSAEQKAAEMLDRHELVQQAQMQAMRIRQQVQQECDIAKDQTIAEIDRIENLAQQELEEMRRKTILECEAIQRGADEYADGVLLDMEQRLSEMLRVIRNGRQQLHVDRPSDFSEGL